jgi:hypothetical protein
MANATATRENSDLDAQSPAADLVRVYLNGIGKTALLNAADEVELAKRIEAGLYAQYVLAGTCSRPTFDSSSRWRSATPDAGCRCSISSRRGTWV